MTILGDKKVYWSTTKIASHIRSGHCPGTSEEEVKRFKDEFVYETPKNLVHKSLKRKPLKSPEKVSIKKQKEDEDIIQGQYEIVDNDNNEDHEHIVYEVEGAEGQEEKLEIVYMQENYRQRETETSASPTVIKEEKFISTVYPQFKGKTKLQLIDDILDLTRQNELLQAKVKTYENTIHKLL